MEELFFSRFVRQNDKHLREQIRGDGCYFMSILALYQMESRVVLDPIDINEVYEEAIKCRAINENCYVYIDGFQKIFDLLNQRTPTNLQIEFLASWKKDGANNVKVWQSQKSTDARPNYFISRYKRPLGMKTYHHFIVSDKNGNVVFDPIVNSKTVKYGSIKETIVFEVKG
jgi:hypothetical protein